MAAPISLIINVHFRAILERSHHPINPIQPRLDLPYPNRFRVSHSGTLTLLRAGMPHNIMWRCTDVPDLLSFFISILIGLFSGQFSINPLDGRLSWQFYSYYNIIYVWLFTWNKNSYSLCPASRLEKSPQTWGTWNLKRILV